MVMEAWVHGVSTRNVDALVVALGGTGISKSEVSRICQALDEEVGKFPPAAWTSPSIRMCFSTPPICMSAPVAWSPPKLSG